MNRMYFGVGRQIEDAERSPEIIQSFSSLTPRLKTTSLFEIAAGVVKSKGNLS